MFASVMDHLRWSWIIESLFQLYNIYISIYIYIYVIHIELRYAYMLKIYICIYAEAENASFLCQDEIQTSSNSAKTWNKYFLFGRETLNTIP